MGRSPLNEIGLSYLTLRFKVSSNRKHHLTWLLEFLAPPFQIIDSKTFHCKISVIENDKAYRRLLKRLPHSRRELCGFNFDNSTYKLLQCSENGRWRVLFDEEMEVYYIVNVQRTRALILYQGGPSCAVRIALMRVLREYAMNYDHPEGGYFLHSAAFAYQEKGVLIAGPKNSAKTSLLMYFLLHRPSQYISNDRVFLYFHDHGFVIQGMPTVITVPQDTLTLFSGDGVHLPIHRYHFWYSLGELKSRPAMERGPTNGYFTITPRQFSELLGAPSCSRASLSAILFPRLSKEDRGFSLTRLTKEEAVGKIKEARLGKNLTPTESFFHLPSSKDTSSAIGRSYDDFINRCASEIVCLECIVGDKAYDREQAESLMSQILYMTT